MIINLRTNGLKQAEIDKLNLACQHAERVLNTDAFKQWVLNFKWNKTTVTGPFWRRYKHVETIKGFHYTDLANEQVYNKIMGCEEVLGGEGVDNEADIFFEIDRRASRNVIGYTYNNSRWQWMYLNFFKNYSVADIASNLTHEYMHKLGFDHEYKYNAWREYSVPYAVGYFVGNVTEELLNHRGIAM